LVANPQSAGSVIKMSESAAISTRECIAILDDDASVRKALARLIAAYSYRVETYSSAREFIESLNRGVPDCLILDLQMQDITGLELQHYLNRRGTPIPTIVLTAQDEAGTHERCIDAGAVAFLVKPVAKEQLLWAIEATTRNHSPLGYGRQGER
jgi:FixJ family two-component response regulator